MSAKSKYELCHQPCYNKRVNWSDLDEKQRDTVTRSWGMEGVTEYYYMVNPQGRIISRRLIDIDAIQ
jgi:hypothetical protein